MYTGGTGSRNHQHLLYARLGAKYSGPVFSPNPQVALRGTTITVEILPRSNLGPGMFLSDPTESLQTLLLTVEETQRGGDMLKVIQGIGAGAGFKTRDCSPCSLLPLHIPALLLRMPH